MDLWKQLMRNIGSQDALNTIEVLDIAPLIDQPDNNVTYIGYAPISTLTSVALWRIKRITENCTIPAAYPGTAIGSVGSGTNTIEEWADGNMQYDNIWDNRASLTYVR